MSQTSLLSDVLTRIRNAQRVGHKFVYARFSVLVLRVLSVLQKEGYIDSYEEIQVRDGVKDIKINLKYYRGKPVVRELKMVSKPSRRVYSGIDKICSPYNGLGVFILTTPKGVLSDQVARTEGVGGEVLCSVF